ncbi:homoserine dehydrogenase [Bradyrhizobium sp. LM3.4]
MIETQARVLAGRSGRGIRVVAVTARSKAKKRAVDLRGVEWVKDPLALAMHPGIDCFVELMGGSGDPALAAVEAALSAGKSVVTANKALLAKHGLKLAKAAEKHGGALNFEAAVGAAIPVIKTLREGLAGTGINRVYGILNGTCNYILTRMEQEGLSFAECLKDAQRLGYAEANPSFDVDGHDTAQKLAILASLAFGTKVAQSAVYVEGISSIAPEDLRAADDLGYRLKLLGVAVRTAKGIEQRVHPTMVPKSSSIAQVMGVTNAVTIDGEGIPPITLVGPGAGGAATASAVVADIADVARGIRANPFGRPISQLRDTKKAPMERHEGGYYHPPSGTRFPGHRGCDRDPARGAEDFDRVDRAAPPQWRRCAGKRQGGPGARYPDHLCHARGRRAPRARGRAARQGDQRAAAGDPDREELGHAPEKCEAVFRKEHA